MSVKRSERSFKEGCYLFPRVFLGALPLQCLIDTMAQATGYYTRVLLVPIGHAAEVMRRANARQRPAKAEVTARRNKLPRRVNPNAPPRSQPARLTTICGLPTPLETR